MCPRGPDMGDIDYAYLDECRRLLVEVLDRPKARIREIIRYEKALSCLIAQADFVPDSTADFDDWIIPPKGPLDG